MLSQANINTSLPQREGILATQTARVDSIQAHIYRPAECKVFVKYNLKAVRLSGNSKMKRRGL